MKKSLLALAVLGAFAGAASAQSSVTVYGIVDVGFNSTDVGGDNGRTNGIESGNQSASRIGFKGTEDLGGGLKANFQLEGTIAADTGSFSGGFNRVATVGLQGAFGKVDLGRQTSVIKDAYDQIDPFGDGGTIAPISDVFFAGAMGNGRVSNTVKYSTNSYSGFKAQAAYSFGETAGDTSANSAWGVGLGYANGPLNVQFGYHKVDDTDEVTLVQQGEGKAAFIGATYNFGGFKLHAAYGDGKIEDTLAATEFKTRNYLIGATLPLGPGNLIASYSVNDIRSFDEADSKKAAIMYTYDLSKRTNLYVGYSHTSNDDNVNLAGGPVGESNSVAAVGIRHKF